MMVHIKPRVSFGLLSTISSARMLTNLICVKRKKREKMNKIQNLAQQNRNLNVHFKQWKCVLRFDFRFVFSQSFLLKRDSWKFRRRHWTTARAIISHFIDVLPKSFFSFLFKPNL
jgi:hypothetical protein